MSKLVIDRTKWFRGDSRLSKLIVPEADNKMCCLGFYAKECGYTDDEILGFAEPGQLIRAKNSLENWQYEPIENYACKFDKRLLDVRWWDKENADGTPARQYFLASSDLCHSLMHYNDSIHMPDKQREEKLTELFKQIDVEVEFIN